MTRILGCHLVGSVPLPDAATVFSQCSAGMPDRLKRIPDGETGFRNWFTFWQSAVFQRAPEMLTEFVNNAPIERGEFTPEEIDDGIAKLKDGPPLETGYDTVAIESYESFKKMRREGKISKGTKFQVSIPTPANIMAPFVQVAFQPRVEPIYEEALFRAMRNLQDKIPHEDLAIQIDLAVDTMYWEGIDMYKPWFGGDIKQYMVDYTVRMIAQVDQDVEVGLHNCYGDMEHKHWAEPESLAIVVERGLRIIEATPHPLNFFHCPVPISALPHLESYLAPLKDLVPKLQEHNTELYLGVIHFDNLDATKQMIEAAAKVAPEFGVATECGMGRTPPEQVENILKLSSEVSEPVL